jgi:hypothetical protein
MFYRFTVATEKVVVDMKIAVIPNPLMMIGQIMFAGEMFSLNGKSVSFAIPDTAT